MVTRIQSPEIRFCIRGKPDQGCHSDQQCPSLRDVLKGSRTNRACFELACSIFACADQVLKPFKPFVVGNLDVQKSIVACPRAPRAKVLGEDEAAPSATTTSRSLAQAIWPQIMWPVHENTSNVSIKGETFVEVRMETYQGAALVACLTCDCLLHLRNCNTARQTSRVAAVMS